MDEDVEVEDEATVEEAEDDKDEAKEDPASDEKDANEMLLNEAEVCAVCTCSA